MNKFEPEKLCAHRPLLLAMEAIGWLHMVGKAKADFLRGQCGQSNNYKYDSWFKFENPQFPWSDMLEWVKNQYPLHTNSLPSMTSFVTDHALPDPKPGLLGLLQAGHAMSSGIEKNYLPGKTSDYLKQDVTHTWQFSAFGHPVRNLLSDPPEVLTDNRWQDLVEQIHQILNELKEIGQNDSTDVEDWNKWRENSIGKESLLRQAFTSTVAETRLPNNDVTLWDQSYVAAALFKSAVAYAILEGTDFDWNNERVKQNTCWRLLIIGIGTTHYESRAVKIGDWKGSQQAIEEFFLKMQKLVEVYLACGSLLYRDTKVAVFSFPGEQDGANSDLSIIQSWENYFQEQANVIARELKLETPPYCRISGRSRSLILLTRESQKARETLEVPVVPVQRYWEIPSTNHVKQGHVCPVCFYRFNESYNDKQKPCPVCYGRRHHRLDNWLKKENLEKDTIWIDEIADYNDRVALLTFSIDIEPWLDGTRIDSFRAQAISELYLNNNKLAQNIGNQTKDKVGRHNMERLAAYFEKRINRPPRDLSADPIIPKIFAGANNEELPPNNDPTENWKYLFNRIVADRAHDAQWDPLVPKRNAHWLVFQAFRKNCSPGRVYRFWRQTESFFQDCLQDFRDISSCDPNRWIVRRLIIKPDSTTSSGWQNHEIYNSRWRDSPLELLYRQDQGDFLTISNLARLLSPEESKDALKGEELKLRDEKGHEMLLKIKDVNDNVGSLGIYHPIIPLEISPLRFRVIVPLKAASECISNTINAWEEQLSRVWDRLPLRIGIVAFPRMMPFQAVIEATRNIEDELQKRSEQSEIWHVADSSIRNGIVTLRLVREKDNEQETKLVPVRLPDGRDDVFYPYMEVEDPSIRFARDFQHPNGQVYRHVKDLRAGEGIKVLPAVVATLFMETTAARFDPIEIHYLADWKVMQDVWEIIQRTAPSQTALRGFWSDLESCRKAWQNPDGSLSDGGEQAWLELARAMLSNRLVARGASLDMLMDSARTGLLRWSLEWHLRVLKESVGGIS